MGKHYPRNRKRPKLAPSEKRVTPADWEALAASPRDAEAYSRFAQEISRAQAEAEQRAARMKGVAPAELLDVRRAVAILDEHPALYRYVRAAAQREHREALVASTAQALPSMLTLSGSGGPMGSPTGSAPQAGSALGMAWAGTRQSPISVPNARQLRTFADSGEWLRAAINIRRDQVAHAELAVLPEDEDEPYNKQIQEQALMILDQPNELKQNWGELIASVAEDVLVLDRGVMSKSMTLASRQPTALYVEDGATIAIYPVWSGDPAQPRYLFSEPGTDRRVPLRNDEAVVMMANPASYRLGLSPVQVLWETLKADLKATQLAMQLVEQKPPPHMVQIPGYSQAQLEQLAESYLTGFAGRKELFFIGGQESAQVFPLVFSAKDNQFLEWQTWLARKICALMRISPQQVGITFDINKATAGAQQDIFEDTGLIPLLLLIELYLNREFLADFAPRRPDGRTDMAALNLRLMFPQISEAARMLHAKEVLGIAQASLAGLPSMTINQTLAMRGEEPVPGGDTFYMPSQSGAIPWLSYNGELGDYVKDPTATAPALGGQDAAGGPEQEQPEGVGAAPEDDKPRSTAQAPQGNEQAAAPEKPAAPTAAASDKGSSKAARRPAYPIAREYRPPRDLRPAGTAWRPSHNAPRAKSARKPTPTGHRPEPYNAPPGVLQARVELDGMLTRLFNDVERRGAELLSRLEASER